MQKLITVLYRTYHSGGLQSLTHLAYDSFCTTAKCRTKHTIHSFSGDTHLDESCLPPARSQRSRSGKGSGRAICYEYLQILRCRSNQRSFTCSMDARKHVVPMFWIPLTTKVLFKFSKLRCYKYLLGVNIVWSVKLSFKKKVRIREVFLIIQAEQN